MDINEKQTNDTIKILKDIDAIKPSKTQTKKDEKMVSEIEKEQSSLENDINLEYFVDGKRKFYVPCHHSFKQPDVMLLQAENMILRFEIKTGMARRIDEFET